MANLNYTISVTDSEIFKSTFDLLIEILKDDNISEDIRNKYKEKLFNTLDDKVYDLSELKDVKIAGE